MSETPNPLDVLRDYCHGLAARTALAQVAALAEAAQAVDTAADLALDGSDGPPVAVAMQYQAALRDIRAALVPFAAHKDTNHA